VTGPYVFVDVGCFAALNAIAVLRRQHGTVTNGVRKESECQLDRGNKPKCSAVFVICARALFGSRKQSSETKR